MIMGYCVTAVTSNEFSTPHEVTWKDDCFKKMYREDGQK